MLSMRERVPLLRHMASEVGNACRCAGNVRPLDDSSLAASVFIKMLLYHFIGKFLVASRPKRHRLAQIYLLRLGAGNLLNRLRTLRFDFDGVVPSR
jgi:hypothetical protein